VGHSKKLRKGATDRGSLVYKVVELPPSDFLIYLFDRLVASTARVVLGFFFCCDCLPFV